MVKFVGNPESIPEKSRNGDWKQRFENEYSKNPGKVYQYTGISSSTAANLRRDYGVDASTQTIEGELNLFVVWRPEKAEEIKSKYKKNQNKAASEPVEPETPVVEGNATAGAKPRK